MWNGYKQRSGFIVVSHDPVGAEQAPRVAPDQDGGAVPSVQPVLLLVKALLGEGKDVEAEKLLDEGMFEGGELGVGEPTRVTMEAAVLLAGIRLRRKDWTGSVKALIAILTS